MKCRAKREMRDTKRITMKNGKPAAQGMCSICGTKMYRKRRVKTDIVGIIILREAGYLYKKDNQPFCYFSHTYGIKCDGGKVISIIALFLVGETL